MTMLRYLAVLLCARLSRVLRGRPIRAGARLRSAEQGLPGRPCCAESISAGRAVMVSYGQAGRAVMVSSGQAGQASLDGWAGHGG